MKADGLAEMIQKYNPFFFKEGNEILNFKNYGEVYLYALKLLKKHFPRGYIDVPLFLNIATGQPLAVCTEFTRRSSFLLTINGGIFLCESADGQMPKEKYERLMRALHVLSNTQFSQDYFNWAWEEFVSQSGVKEE